MHEPIGVLAGRDEQRVAWAYGVRSRRSGNGRARKCRDTHAAIPQIAEGGSLGGGAAGGAVRAMARQGPGAQPRVGVVAKAREGVGLVKVPVQRRAALLVNGVA